MTPVELLKECERGESQGLSWILLTIPRRRRRRSERVRVMPGCIGTVVGGCSADRLLVSVEIVDVVRALERVMLRP